MLAGGKKKTSSSFGPDGRRIGGGGLGAGGGPRRVIKTVGKRGAGLANPAMLKSSPAGAAAAAGGGSGITTISDCAPSKTCFGRGGGGGLGLTSRGPHATNKLFQPGVKLKIQRAPMMTGLSVGAGVRKPFQRPQLGRRAYDKNSEAALKRATLGQKRRMDGMSKLLARAGKGLNYKTPGRAKSGDGDDGSDASCADEEEEEEDSLMAQLERNYKPLMVWQSPHNGGETKGLPKVLRTVTRPDEYGVEEEVTIKTGPPAEAYTKEDQYVPKVLAKWLRPHQREGVKFMYECVMGMRDFDGNGCILADGKWRARIYLFICWCISMSSRAISQLSLEFVWSCSELDTLLTLYFRRKFLLQCIYPIQRSPNRYGTRQDSPIRHPHLDPPQDRHRRPSSPDRQAHHRRLPVLPRQELGQ